MIVNKECLNGSGFFGFSVINDNTTEGICPRCYGFETRPKRRRSLHSEEISRRKYIYRGKGMTWCVGH